MTAGTDHHRWTARLTGNAAPERAGSKAAMLDRLIALGAPVPASGIVGTDAYRAFVASSGLEPLLERLRAEALPSPAEQAAARSRVDSAFLQAPMPAGLEEAIRRLAAEVGGGGPLSVRSSATAEDLATASFAGQYRTLLGVEPDEAVRAVRLCWASLWHPTVRAYRRFRGIDEGDLAMAALVMPMLTPSQAGVLFTEAPGAPESLRIELVEGLGEALVSGARTPRVVLVERASLDAFQPEVPALRQLARVAIDLETAMGAPLDIEWAVEDGTLWLLQARPITATGVVRLDDGFDVGDGDATRYTTAGIAEMLPGVQAPRIWDANSWLVEEAFCGLFDRLGGDIRDLDRQHALIGRFHGRAALNLDLMERAVESIPGASTQELEHQYFGDSFAPDAGPPAARSGGDGLLQGIRTLRARAHAYEESEVVIQAIDLVVDGEPQLEQLPHASLLALRRRVLHLACRTMDAEVSVAATASASYRSLEIFLREHLDPEDAQQALQRLTATERGALRGRRALALDALARQLASDPDLEPLRAIGSWPEARAALARSEAGRAFHARLRTALHRAGSTSAFGGVTWDTVPELVWPMLRAGPRTAGSDPKQARAEAYDQVERSIGRDPRWRSRRAITGQLLDIRTRFLRREAKDAAAFLERREQTKASLLVLGGVLWRIDQELGRRLQASGRLEEAEDVELLASAEIALAFRGEGAAAGRDRPAPPA